MTSDKYSSNIFVWTSSHGRDHHFLPFWLKKKFELSPFEKPPKVIAKSGGRIDACLVHEITCKAIEISPHPQYHFLFYGDNNMRPNREDSEETFDVLQYFEELISNFSNFSNCHLVISSIIPCPLTDPNSKAKFKEFNNSLIKVINRENERGFQRVSFLNLTKTFLFQGEIQDEEEMFEQDGIHLTSRGALTLTDRTLEHLRILPKSMNFEKKVQVLSNY